MDNSTNGSVAGLAEPKAKAGRAATISKTFVLHNLHGLHARPAALLVRTLQHFRCEMLVTCGDATANGQSIFGLMTLAAGPGSKLSFAATGPDAAPAMEAVAQLFSTNFHEAY
ncbi:MAG TPA: HPr family phosphocarrier protein [Dongiaceae bacterium]|nr:HPr family phosphocarrier protein [Dongiaceae bacterium]